MMKLSEEEIYSMLENACKDYASDTIHIIVENYSKDFSDFTALSSVMEKLFNISMLEGCKELLKLKAINNCNLSENMDLLDTDINKSINRILNNVSTTNLNIIKGVELIIAFYTISDYENCNNFLIASKKAKEYIRTMCQLCVEDLVFSQHLYDIIIFILGSTKNNDDFLISTYIDSIEMNPQKADLFIKTKKTEISILAKGYFENEKYISLSTLMSIFERHSCLEGSYKHKIYEYLDVEKEYFKEKAFINGTASALELYFLVEYFCKFPTLSELKHILDLGTSSSVYCVVYQCLRKIEVDVNIDENVEEILSWIKDNIEIKDKIDKKIKFEYFDEAIDPGISNALMRKKISVIFSILCENGKDVWYFLHLISRFNIFFNTQLGLDYKVVEENKDYPIIWQREYEYVYNRYCNIENHSGKFASVVMSSYLRFFVDLEDLYMKCGKQILKFWFPAYETNSGKIKLYSARLNKQFRDKGYVIKRRDKKKSPEEYQNIRIKVRYIDFEKKIIYIVDNEDKEDENNPQSILEEWSKAINNAALSSLSDGDIIRAYKYLANNDNPEYSLYGHDKYVPLNEEKNKKFGIDIEQLFFDSKKEFVEYIQYIYLNSRIRSFVSIDKMLPFFDCKQNFLGDIRLQDNRNYKKDEYFYIDPNYYNPRKIVFRILKKNISKEMRRFLNGQLKRIKGMELKGNQIQAESVRVSFYVKKNVDSIVGEIVEVSNMCVHCCDNEISDLCSLVRVYHSKVEMKKRTGIANRVLQRYMEAYKECYERHSYTNEWYMFINVYLEYLNKKVSNIYQSRCNELLFKEEEKYTSLYYVLQLNMLKGLHFDEGLKNYIYKNKYYIMILKTLKSCYRERNKSQLQQEKYEKFLKMLYEHTIFNNIFNSVEEMQTSALNINVNI